MGAFVVCKTGSGHVANRFEGGTRTRLDIDMSGAPAIGATIDFVEGRRTERRLPAKTIAALIDQHEELAPFRRCLPALSGASEGVPKRAPNAGNPQE